MRLIDADALLEKLWRIRWNLQMMDDTQTADKMMAGLRKAEEKIEAAPTIDHTYGFPLEHLAFIARVMEEEGITPEKVSELLRDVSKISEMVVDVTQTIREAVRRIDDDPSHPFADGVMMKE